jgi:hypothetical protein
MENRKKFIQRLLLGIGFISVTPFKILSSSPIEDCEDEKGKFFLHLQERDMNEKAALFKKLIDRFGKDVLGIVKDQVISETESRLRNADLLVRNLDAVMENLWDHTKLTHTFKVITRTDEQLELRVTQCFYADVMRKSDAAQIGDVFYCAYDHGFCKGLNSDIKFTRTKTLMQGNECCNHIYELKK